MFEHKSKPTLILTNHISSIFLIFIKFIGTKIIKTTHKTCKFVFSLNVSFRIAVKLLLEISLKIFSNSLYYVHVLNSSVFFIFREVKRNNLSLNNRIHKTFTRSSAFFEIFLYFETYKIFRLMRAISEIDDMSTIWLFERFLNKFERIQVIH